MKIEAIRNKKKVTGKDGKEKEMRHKRDRDKLKSNLSPTLTLSPLSFKLSLKWCNAHENSSLTNVGHKHSLRV